MTKRELGATARADKDETSPSAGAGAAMTLLTDASVRAARTEVIMRAGENISKSRERKSNKEWCSWRRRFEKTSRLADLRERNVKAKGRKGAGAEVPRDVSPFFYTVSRRSVSEWGSQVKTDLPRMHCHSAHGVPACVFVDLARGATTTLRPALQSMIMDLEVGADQIIVGLAPSLGSFGQAAPYGKPHAPS